MNRVAATAVPAGVEGLHRLDREPQLHPLRGTVGMAPGLLLEALHAVAERVPVDAQPVGRLAPAAPRVEQGAQRVHERAACARPGRAPGRRTPRGPRRGGRAGARASRGHGTRRCGRRRRPARRAPPAGCGRGRGRYRGGRRRRVPTARPRRPPRRARARPPRPRPRAGRRRGRGARRRGRAARGRRAPVRPQRGGARTRRRCSPSASKRRVAAVRVEAERGDAAGETSRASSRSCSRSSSRSPASRSSAADTARLRESSNASAVWPWCSTSRS